MKKLTASLLLLLSLVQAVSAHETTRSYATVTRDGDQVTAALRIAFRDIEVAIWMDEDLDGTLTWGEVSRRLDTVADYASRAIALDAGGPCHLTRRGAGASTDAGVAFLDLQFAGTCPDAGAPLRVTSRLFAEIDPDHRLFLTTNPGPEATTTLLAPGSVAEVSDESGGSAGFLSYFAEGARHLLEGADHLMFLLVLVLPAVAVPENQRRAVLSVLGAVTGFTLAHALTLTAAATQVLRPPTALVEFLIALSIVVTALDNLRPFLPGPRAAVASFFGLIHGFGFATALGAAHLTGFGFVAALAGFNLGIEAAQIGIVLVLLPALYALRKGRAVLWIGSLTALAVGLYWVWQRLGF